MSVKKFRWSNVYESSEEELLAYLQTRGIASERVHVTVDEPVAPQYTDNSIRIWCAEGSCKLGYGATNVSLQPGDAIRLPAATAYTIQPGIADCSYYLTV